MDEERGISRVCRRLLWWADVLVTFHEVFTGQGNSKLLPVRTFDVDVLQITFHLFFSCDDVMEWMKKEGFQGYADVFFGGPMF